MKKSSSVKTFRKAASAFAAANTIPKIPPSKWPCRILPASPPFLSPRKSAASKSFRAPVFSATVWPTRNRLSVALSPILIHNARALSFTPQTEKLSVALWSILTLLFLSIFISYIDRGALSIAAPTLEQEFSISPWQLGKLLSAFFWTYTPFLILSGWLADRFHAAYVLAIGFAVWS